MLKSYTRYSTLALAMICGSLGFGVGQACLAVDVECFASTIEKHPNTGQDYISCVSVRGPNLKSCRDKLWESVRTHIRPVWGVAYCKDEQQCQSAEANQKSCPSELKKKP